MSFRRRLKIGVSGVRGVVGESFSPILAADFAAAFGEFLGGGRVLIGRDTRASGEIYENAVVTGLLAVGCQPVLVGIIPTPTLQIALRESSASGAIAITASHNENEWNALKFIGPDAMFLNQIGTDELLDIYNQPESRYVRENDIRSVKRLHSAFKSHQDIIFRHIDVNLIRKSSFKVAVDCCNGVGALYSKKFLEDLGCSVVSIFDSVESGFERCPEPVPENLGELSKAVLSNSCDIGFAQDPDGDRISLVSEKGVPLGVQNSVLVMAEHVMSRKHGGSIAANVQTTRAVEDIASKYGGKVFYSPVGEVNVTALMTAKKADFGIEGSSGGILWPEVHLCRDSFSAMALTLEMMALRRQMISEIMDSIKHYSSHSAKIECPSAQTAVNALRNIAAKYKDRNPVVIDGVRIDFGDSWVLVRQSNTEPVIRVLAEAENQEKAAALAVSFVLEIRPMLDTSLKQ